MEAYQRRGGTKRRGRVTRVISTMETGLSTGGGVGVEAVWVQRFAIITFRACRFVCINSVRQFPLCGVRSRARISSSAPSPSPRPPPTARESGVFGAILSRKDLLSAGIGKRFIFPALFSPPVPSLLFFMLPRVLLSFRFFVNHRWRVRDERRHFSLINNLM